MARKHEVMKTTIMASIKENCGLCNLVDVFLDDLQSNG